MTARPPLLLCGLLLLTGCFSRETTVHLRPDGSGELVVDTTATAALLKYLRGLAGGTSAPDWFGEAPLREAAANYGEGLDYKSHEVVEAENGRTFRVVYGFEDVTGLEIGLDMSMPFLPNPPGRTRNGSYPPFRFRKTAEGAFVIRPPVLPSPSFTSPRVVVETAGVKRRRQARFREDLEVFMRHGNPFELSGEETPESMIRTLTDRMSFRIRVVPEGVVAATNARYRTDGGFDLFEVRVSEALRQDRLMKRAVEGNLGGLGWAELVENPAVRVEPSERVRLYLREE